MAFETAMEIFELTEKFPALEKYSLTDQIRRSSRSVCSNIAEAFRKRRYPKSFIAKLNDSEGESAETQVWIEFSLKLNYISKVEANNLYSKYDDIIGKLVIMSRQPEKWVIS
ncbi:four helix bundle protein [candidate division KSB1 bacterium]